MSTLYNSRPTTVFAPSAQHYSITLPSQSTWAGPRSQPKNISNAHGPSETRSNSNNNNADGSPGLLPNPPGLTALQHQANECETKRFMQAAITISTALSDGVENPEILVQNFNAVLEEHGYSPIIVPTNVITSSKRIYSSKLANSYEVISQRPLVSTPTAATGPTNIAPMFVTPVTTCPTPTHKVNHWLRSIPPMPTTSTSGSTMTSHSTYKSHTPVSPMTTPLNPSTPIHTRTSYIPPSTTIPFSTMHTSSPLMTTHHMTAQPTPASNMTHSLYMSPMASTQMSTYHRSISPMTKLSSPMSTKSSQPTTAPSRPTNLMLNKNQSQFQPISANRPMHIHHMPISPMPISPMPISPMPLSLMPITPMPSPYGAARYTYIPPMNSPSATTPPMIPLVSSLLPSSRLQPSPTTPPSAFQAHLAMNHNIDAYAVRTPTSTVTTASIKQQLKIFAV